MQTRKHLGASAQTNTGVSKLSLEDQFKLERAIAAKRLVSDKEAHQAELERNLGGLEQVNFKYVEDQYKVYNYLTDTHTEDQARIHSYFENMPSGDRVGWKRDALLGNDVFEAKIGNYEGRQSVIDFAQDKECQNLKTNNPDLWNQYFYERSWSNAPDSSNNRWAPKLRLFQDKTGKAYKNIKENFAKQEHIPQNVKDIVAPYLKQMGVVTEARDQAYYHAVGANILKINNYDPSNKDHMRRAMKAGAAIKEFYGDWMTDTVTDDGDRRVSDVSRDGAVRGVSRSVDFDYALVLGD